MVENANPIARLQAMNTPSANSSSGIEPRTGTANTMTDTSRISAVCT